MRLTEAVGLVGAAEAVHLAGAASGAADSGGAAGGGGAAPATGGRGRASETAARAGRGTVGRRVKERGTVPGCGGRAPGPVAIVSSFVLVLLGAVVGPVVAGCGDRRERNRVRRRDAGPAVIVVDPAGAGRPAVDEKEPNDDVAAAQALVLPGRLRGTIGRAGDVDRYRFSLSAPTTVSLAIRGAEDADLVVDVLDSAGRTVVRSDNGPAGVPEGAPNLGLQPDDYLVVVSEFVPKTRKGKVDKGGKPSSASAPRATPSRPYFLEVVAVPPPASGEETEPNDSTAFAGELPLSGVATGFVGWRRDRDFWRVPLTGVGEDDALSIDVDAVADVALRVAVLDSTEAVLLERRGRVGEPVALRNVAIRPGEPHYFVVVSAARGNLEERYTLRAASAPFQIDEEAEPNDAIGAAGPLADIPTADAGMRVGYLSRDDVDLFRLEPAEEPRTLRVTLEPPPGVDGVVAILDETGGALVEPADAGRAGAPETLSAVVPPNRPVFVRVTAKSGASATERYRLRWSSGVETPALGLDE